MLLIEVFARTAQDLERDLGRSPGGNLAIWLTFVGAMFTAGTTVMIGSINRGRKQNASDHADVQLLLQQITSNQEAFGVDISEIRSSLRKVHERIDLHLEHHTDREDRHE